MTDDALGLVHRLRAVTVELNLLAGEFSASHGLHSTDLRAVIALLDADREGIAASPGWLAAKLSLNSASVTALLDRLEAGGYVERQRDARDRRRVVLVVTEAAVGVGWAFFGPIIASFEGAMGEFTSEELATIGRFLDATAGVIDMQRRPRHHTA